MKHKSCSAQFKALDDKSGTFEAIVSVFGNVDFAGDRVIKGAFAKSIQKWKASGDPIPVIWSHMWNEPDAHIGKTVEAEETDEGLKIKGQLDLDDPFAAKVFKLLKERRVKEFSFAYDVVEERSNKEDKSNDLLELAIIEVGPTLKGMNPETQLIAAKAVQEAFGAKAGRVLSSKNESALRTAYETIGEVLKQLDEKPEEPKATQEPTKAIVPPQVEPQEPTKAIGGHREHWTALIELAELTTPA